MASIGKDAALLAGLVTLLVTQPLLAYGSVATRILFDGMFAAVLLGVVFIIFGRRWERKLDPAGVADAGSPQRCCPPVMG
jgi:hypothetical protein